MRVALLCLLAACAGPPKDEGPPRPDQVGLERETRVEAEKVTIVASDHWRGEAKLEGIRVEHGENGVDRARGGATFKLLGLDVQAAEIEVRWLGDHEDFVLYASNVAHFEQRREQPYTTGPLDKLTIANDHVSFFQK